jgi:threonine dehydratase
MPPRPESDDPITLGRIREAASLLRGEIVETPTLHSRTLSKITGAEVFLKFENLQFTGSFKDRGALVKLRSLDPEARERGVVAASRGNHAQAVAYHAQRLSIPATIVMPRRTPNIKVERTAHFGARVVLHGATLEEAAAHATSLAEEQGLTIVHPYDDADVICGQGTVGLEMLERVPDLEALIVPIGGGGLISGIAVAAQGLKPDLAVFGVESARFPSMRQALAGQTVECGTATLADGIAVKQPGHLTRAIVRERVRDILVVEEQALEQAIGLLIEIEKTIAEGAGAASLAALLSDPERFAGQRVGILISGGNIDPIVIARVIERDLARTSRLVRLRIVLPDYPSALAAVTELIAEEEANIVEVWHQRTFTRLALESAEVDLMLETRGHDHARRVCERLGAKGYPTRMLDTPD